jgi:GNAT superfamily N-acetyltransferase
MKLRRASNADAAALADFAAAAFWETYGHVDDPKGIANYVSEHFNRQATSECIGDPATITLLAEVNSELAGYAQLRQSEAPSCVTGPAPLELARLYLGKGFIGQGHGAALMLAVHSEARRLSARTLWLGVYDRNVRAVRFYEHFGFVKIGDKEFWLGDQVYIDHIYSGPVRIDA